MLRPANKRFDHYYRDFEQAGALLQEHVHKGTAEFQRAKKNGFRMAQAAATIMMNFHEELLRHTQTTGETIDQWLERWFAPMYTMGEDWRELFAAVQKGMTLAKYLSTTPGVFLAKGRKRRARVELQPALPDEPSEKLSSDEALRQWRSRARALEVQLRDERRRRRAAEHRAAVLDKAVKRLSRDVGKAVA